MKKYLYSEQNSLFGHKDVIGFGTDFDYVIEMPRDVANVLIANNHYSGNFYNASYIHLAVYHKTDIMIGVIQLGYAMNPQSMSSVVKNTKLDEYLELNRMWFTDNSPKNCKSMAISNAIKFIRMKYPKIKWIQSFADERCNKLGIVYQACNFEYCGEHITSFYEFDGKYYHKSLMERDPNLRKSAKYIQENKAHATKHNLRQFRYIFFIKKHAKKDLLLKIQKPPKHYENRTLQEHI